MPKVGGGGISARLLPVNLPDKTEYIEGEQLDLSGLSLKFEEIGGELSTVSEYKTIPENGSVLKRGISSIQVNYKKDNVLYSAFIPIIVKYTVGIEVASFPKHSYKTKDALNTSGLKINLIYNDGSIKEIDNGFTTLPENGSVIGETTEIKITYGNMATYYKINIDNVSSAISKSGLVSNYLATFKNATDVQIEELLNFHYAGDIDIADYWKVGDFRTFNQSSPSYSFKLKIVDFNRTINSKTCAVVLIIEQYYISYRHYYVNDSNLVIGNGGGGTSYPNLNKECLVSIKSSVTTNSYASTNSTMIYNYINDNKIFKFAPYEFTNKITFIIEKIPDTEDNYKCTMRNSETVYGAADAKTIPVIKKYVDGGDESFKYFKIASNRKEVSGQMITDYHFKQEDSNYFSFSRISGFGISPYYSVNSFNVNLYAYEINSDGRVIERAISSNKFLNIFSLYANGRLTLHYDISSNSDGITNYKSFCFL